MLTGKIDQELLRLERMQPVLKQARGVRKLSDIKLMQEDPEGVDKTSEEIKARYAQIFKV